MKLLLFSIVVLFTTELRATIVPRLELESEFSRKKHILKAKQEKQIAEGDLDNEDIGLEIPSFLNISGTDKSSPFAHTIITSFDNDNFLLLDRIKESSAADDFGQTHAMFFNFLRYDKRDGSQSSIEFETGLYTELFNVRLDPKDPNRFIASQYFREISTLSWNQKWPTDTFGYLKTRTEIGLINEKKPIWGLALWQQSGNSGDGGFHDLIGFNVTTENMARGPRQGFAGIGFGYGRLFPLSWNSDLLFDWNEVDIIVEASTILRTVWEGTQFDLKAKVNIPLIRVFALSNSNKFLSLNFQEILHYFPDVSSTGTSTSVGLQFQFTAFGLSLSATFPNGNQNPAFMRYIDRDPVHSLTFFGEI